MQIADYLRDKDWAIVDTFQIPSRQADFYTSDDLELSVQSQRFLHDGAPEGIYLHQKESIKAFLDGKNICLTTGTASGKSLVFYSAAMEQIVKNPNCKILAVYPLRALGQEQEERWIKALSKANLNVKVGRIDGQVPMNTRSEILRNCQVLILTPDIIHAWLLHNLSNKHIVEFLTGISLIVADEVHNYAGVFGSNSALLFRRLQHSMDLLDVHPSYITASATIADPELHLKKLFGLDFVVIDSSSDTSPRQAITVRLVEPPDTKDLLSTLSEFMKFITRNTDHRFISFVDSRKQVEYITSIAARSKLKTDYHDSFDYDHLQKLSILPYRAGYEANDRNTIQKRLSNGTLSGVVSTSALELGIDIPFLTLGILFEVPHSATSFYQRIGRIGRHLKGDIIIINKGDIYSENIFRNPKQLLNMPLSEGALYVENQRMQYIHALCLARHGGEHDQIYSFINGNGKKKASFESAVNWPAGFLELCESERIGVIPAELQNMKAEAGDDPNHTFPLRDVDVQFHVEYKRGSQKTTLGSLSYAQLMREAYPGAVYYYTTKPYRVYRVKNSSRVVEVRHEKRYTTRPQTLPTLVFPNLSPGNVFAGHRYGKLIAVECNLQIREAIAGIKERRGPNETVIKYPLAPSLGFYFDQARFTRNYFTTGVILTHPALNGRGVHCDIIANLLFESFLMIISLERRDINFSSDKYRTNVGVIGEGDKFICVYDQTYGSLRLSGRIFEKKTFELTVKKAFELSRCNEGMDSNPETISALEEVVDSLSESRFDITLESSGETNRFHDELCKEVIMPGSKGLDVKKNNEEFFIDDVFYSPVIEGLAYRGKHISEKGPKFDDVKISVPVDSLVEIPGESKSGLYDFETGEIREIAGT